jgi:hypothetical protein
MVSFYATKLFMTSCSLHIKMVCFTYAIIPSCLCLEWNDCPNRDGGPAQALHWWKQYFFRYESKHWNSGSFGVVRPAQHPETFYFIRKRTLFIGLGYLVGGMMLDSDDWRNRLQSYLSWVKSVINTNVPDRASGVVVMGHAKQSLAMNDNEFFLPFATYIRNQVTAPILYLHGDGHSWLFTRNFYGEQNYLRIQKVAGTNEPPLIMKVDTYNSGNDPVKAFKYCRYEGCR